MAHVILVSALGPNPSFFLFWGTFIQLGGLLGQGPGLGLGPGLDNKTLNQDNNNPPCFLRYRGSPGEVITSFLSSLIEPVSVENERSYCPFDDLETSGRGTITSFGSSVDINILTCARNQER